MKRVIYLASAIGAVILVIVIGLTVSQKRRSDNSNNTRTESQPQSATNQTGNQSGLAHRFDLRQAWSRGKCQGTGTVPLTHLPMNESDFSMYLPYGLMIESHVTPIDHSYFAPADYNSPRDAYPVYAVADGYIVQIGERTIRVDEVGGTKEPEYRLDIEHTCDMYSYMDLITSLTPDIADEFEQSRGKGNVRIPIKAGQMVGKIGGQTLDFGVYLNTLTLPGFANPQSYVHEPWKIHTDDPFKYFVEPIKTKILAKNPRRAEPRAGKIDYDQPGKLVGSWFEEGTNGYAGSEAAKQANRYWDGHVAFAYDYVDPTFLVFSTGNFDGQAGQYAVVDNKPDWATITPASGPVVFEVASYDYLGSDGQITRDFKNVTKGVTYAGKISQTIAGAVRVEMLEPGKVKIESFPGKRAASVSGFTAKARTYVR